MKLRLLPGLGHSPCDLVYRSGIVLVLGTARCVFEDLEKWKEIEPRAYDVMAICEAVKAFEGFTHIATIEPGVAKRYRDILADKMEHPEQVVIHSSGPAPEVDVVWGFSANGGTSSLFATQVALSLGYDKIVLAGCPLDSSGHFYDPPYAPTNPACLYADEGFSHLRNDWQAAANNLFGGDVRSFSGFTKDLLGAPTKEWLEEGVETWPTEESPRSQSAT